MAVIGPGLEEPEHAVANRPLDVLGTAKLLLDASNPTSRACRADLRSSEGSFADKVLADQLQVLLSQQDAIRLDLARDQGLAQPPARLDHDPAAAARDGIDAERHPGGVRLDLLLHDDGHLDLLVVDAIASAVLKGPLSPQGGPAPLDRIETLFERS